MDLLIPLGAGSIWQDNELRYALRSVEKFLTGIDNVWIIGRKPEWITNINHIPMTDIVGTKYRDYNIYLKIVAGCQHPELSKDFFFMSDDHYLLQYFYAPMFRYYTCGLLFDMLMGNPIKQPYLNVLNNTYRYLESNGYGTENYNLHCPIVYNKELFLNTFPDQWPDYGFAIKSMYCNINAVRADYYPELKIRERLNKEEILQAIAGRKFFSFGNAVLAKGGMKQVLPELFSTPSKYEL